MSEMTFEQLHPGAAATLTTGVDLAGVVGFDLLQQASSGDDLSGGSGGDAVVVLPPPTKRTSFSVYWDADSKSLKMYEPRVVYGSKTVEVLNAETISNGSTYYCVVKVTKASSDGGSEAASSGTETVTAELTTTTSSSDEDENTTIACVVPICKIDSDGNVVQYHVGVIVASAASSGAAKYVAGDDTNIVFSNEMDESGVETGNIKIDVYYK